MPPAWLCLMMEGPAQWRIRDTCLGCLLEAGKLRHGAGENRWVTPEGAVLPCATLLLPLVLRPGPSVALRLLR